MLEALSTHLYGCSESASIGELIEDKYYQTFSDVKPRELDGPHFDEADIEALIAGDLGTDGLDAELRINDAPDVAVPTADGGAKPSPDSYSALPGKQSLKQSGPVLAWEDLKEIVSDNGRWSDDLEIHPDRVPEYDPDSEVSKEEQMRLRTKPEPASKVLAAVARYEADVDGRVTGETVDDLIREFVFPLHEWADEDAAWRYFQDTYREKVGEHFWEHPNPAVDLYFVSEDRYKRAVKSNAESLPEDVGAPEPTGDVDTLLDYGDGYLEDQKLTHDSRTAMDWKEKVGEWLEDLAFLRNLQVDHLPHVGADIDHPDTYDGPIHFIAKLTNAHLNTFVEELPDEVRDEILTHHVRDELETEIRDSI